MRWNCTAAWLLCPTTRTWVRNPAATMSSPIPRIRSITGALSFSAAETSEIMSNVGPRFGSASASSCSARASSVSVTCPLKTIISRWRPGSARMSTM